MSNAAFQFSVGVLVVNPIAGNLPANYTPQTVLTIQDVSVDFEGTVKELWGVHQYPDDVAIGERKVTGKFSLGRFDLDLFNNAYFAGTVSAGQTNQIVTGESGTVPSASPYTVTVANSANFKTDLGVQYASTGQKFTRVSTVSAAGQYSVSAGVYTFDSADAGAAVLISYTWNDATKGRTLLATNQLMGYSPSFELWLPFPYNELDAGVPSGIHLFRCKASKVNLAGKNNDYLKPEIDYQGFADPAGNVVELFET